MGQDIPRNHDQARKGIFQTRVTANNPLCREHRMLSLKVEDFPDAAPGQFLQIRCSDPTRPLGEGPVLMRRPFSIGGLSRNPNSCRLDIMLRVVGAGTRWLADLRPGDSVDVVGPLGRPFEIDPRRPLAYLVGGGVGLPPIIWLAEFLHRAGKNIMAFCGARTAELLPLRLVTPFDRTATKPQPGVEAFSRWGIPTLISTDDGSLGARGLIPDHFVAYLDAHPDQRTQAIVYTCGPEPMMRAVAEACGERGVACQVSMERMMACGMGTCQSCVTRFRDATDPQGWSYKLCCTDGPVFWSRDILWDEVEATCGKGNCV